MAIYCFKVYWARNYVICSIFSSDNHGSKLSLFNESYCIICNTMYNACGNKTPKGSNKQNIKDKIAIKYECCYFIWYTEGISY